MGTRLLRLRTWTGFRIVLIGMLGGMGLNSIRSMISSSPRKIQHAVSSYRYPLQVSIKNNANDAIKSRVASEQLRHHFTQLPRRPARRILKNSVDGRCRLIGHGRSLACLGLLGGGGGMMAYAMATEDSRTAANEECARIIQNYQDKDKDIGCVMEMKGVFHEIPILYPNPRDSAGAESLLYGRAVWCDVATDGRLFTPQEKRPVVFVVHAACGQQEDIISWKLKSLAANGYVAFAVDMFGKDRAMWDGPEAKQLRHPLKEDRSIILDRFKASVDAAQKMIPCADMSRLATIGYCFGGMVVLDAARSGKINNLKAAASFHGILDAPKIYSRSAQIKPGTWTKVLVFNGLADPYVPKEKYEEFRHQMDELGMNYEIINYEGVGHAFTRPEKITEEDHAGGFGYNEAADTESWTMAKKMLKEELCD